MSAFVPLMPKNLAHPPVQWSAAEVKAWLKFCVEEFSLSPICASRFDMNGKALCLLTRTDFMERAPHAGDVLHNVFQKLRQQESTIPTGRSQIDSSLFVSNSVHSTQTSPGSRHTYVPILPHPPQPRCSTNSATTVSTCTSANSSTVVSSTAHDVLPCIPASVLSPAPSERSPSDSDSSCINDRSTPPRENIEIDNHMKSPELACHSMFSEDGVSSGEGGCRLLWEFMYQLLEDPRYSEMVCWENQSELTFRINDQSGLAEMWGQQKNKGNMTYEKLSRALRYYYKMNIIQKVRGRRLTYKFLQHPTRIKKGQRGARPHANKLALQSSPRQDTQSVSKQDSDSVSITLPSNNDESRVAQPAAVTSSSPTPSSTVASSSVNSESTPPESFEKCADIAAHSPDQKISISEGSSPDILPSSPSSVRSSAEQLHATEMPSSSLANTVHDELPCKPAKAMVYSSPFPGAGEDNKNSDPNASCPETFSSFSSDPVACSSPIRLTSQAVEVGQTPTTNKLQSMADIEVSGDGNGPRLSSSCDGFRPYRRGEEEGGTVMSREEGSWSQRYCYDERNSIKLQERQEECVENNITVSQPATEVRLAMAEPNALGVTSSTMSANDPSVSTESDNTWLKYGLIAMRQDQPDVDRDMSYHLTRDTHHLSRLTPRTEAGHISPNGWQTSSEQTSNCKVFTELQTCTNSHHTEQRASSQRFSLSSAHPILHTALSSCHVSQENSNANATHTFGEDARVGGHLTEAQMSPRTIVQTYIPMASSLDSQRDANQFRDFGVIPESEKVNKRRSISEHDEHEIDHPLPRKKMRTTPPLLAGDFSCRSPNPSPFITNALSHPLSPNRQIVQRHPIRDNGMPYQACNIQPAHQNGRSSLPTTNYLQRQTADEQYSFAQLISKPRSTISRPSSHPLEQFHEEFLPSQHSRVLSESDLPVLNSTQGSYIKLIVTSVTEPHLDTAVGDPQRSPQSFIYCNQSKSSPPLLAMDLSQPLLLKHEGLGPEQEEPEDLSMKPQQTRLALAELKPDVG